MIACIFSGQGSQQAGMGRDLCRESAAARQVYATAADCLGLDLLDLDEVRMAQTRYAQLAIVTLSLAAWQAWRVAAGEAPPLAFAGFSLGEYSALGAAGVLALPDLLGLVDARARFMQEASGANPGAMYAVIGLDESRLLTVVGKPAYRGRVFAVNFNCPSQVVIAGFSEPTADCAAELQAEGARRLVRLNVSGAFHTPLMADAARQLADYARQLSFRSPEGPIYANRTGRAHGENPDWPAELAAHMASPVLWSEEVTNLRHDGCDVFLEFGPGKVLSGLVRKILPGCPAYPVEDAATLAGALAGSRRPSDQSLKL